MIPTNYLAVCAAVALAMVAPHVGAGAAKPAAAAAAASGPAHFVQKPGAGSLTFTFVQEGAENHGAFRKFDTLLSYDEQDLAHGSLRVTVQMASLDSQSEDRDATLASPELFDSQKFPTATYVASSLAKGANGGVEAVGKLTLRGATRDLRLPLTLKRTAAGYELSGEVTIKRLDYGVGQGEWKSTESVGNDVKITYQVPLVKSAAGAPP